MHDFTLTVQGNEAKRFIAKNETWKILKISAFFILLSSKTGSKRSIINVFVYFLLTHNLPRATLAKATG